MGLEKELKDVEDGAETEAEQLDEETELEDLEAFQDDEEFDPQDDEPNLEEAYEDFYAEEGPDGEGEVSLEGDDGGLAAVSPELVDDDLPEEGFHIVDGEEADGEDEDEDDGYELVELELDEDDIVSYLEDEDGNRIGFVLMEEGEEVEYLYVEDDEEDVASDDNEFDLGITREGVAQATTDVNAIYKDGIAVAAELKGAFDDIKGAFDFTAFLKK